MKTQLQLDKWQQSLRDGQVIPACPLALNKGRRWNEDSQLALLRYYSESGAGGLAVGVHTTQFAIRDPKVGLFKPLTRLLGLEMQHHHPHLIRIGGICGPTAQAIQEAEWLRAQGYHAGLLSLGALRSESEPALIEHCRVVSEIIPIVGFYLQIAVGGRYLSSHFWRGIADLENLVAVKIAPFNRYQTLDVIRALVEAGRDDVALYTGNDDHIVGDLVTPFRFRRGSRRIQRHIVGGLLGQWAVWTRRAVKTHQLCLNVSMRGRPIPPGLLRLGVELTDANAALFDAANDFQGCIAGIHEALRRDGLLDGNWCLDPDETLSPGQKSEISRVWKAYPQLRDDGPDFDFTGQFSVSPESPPSSNPPG